MAASRPVRLGERLRIARRDRAETRARESRSRLQDLVVITGFSGAGKSTAMNVFEDAGYFCVDNLPPEMIRALVELFMHEGSKVERAAVVSDVRGGDYFETLNAVLEDLVELGLHHRVVFLDADEQTLLNRFKETRRRHPLAEEGSLAAAIGAERDLLEPLKRQADVVIDTTGLHPGVLRHKIGQECLAGHAPVRLAVTMMSFGFKHGPARDVDLAVDVRFLPNPYYQPDLRPLTGHDPRVVRYIASDGRLDDLYEHLVPLLDFLLPQYVAEGKSHLQLAIGCTGGRHRSVAIVEGLGRRDQHGPRRYEHDPRLAIQVVHRDLDKRPRDADPGAPPR
jgi:UPF0042 nucleotide-binding protein